MVGITKETRMTNAAASPNNPLHVVRFFKIGLLCSLNPACSILARGYYRSQAGLRVAGER
ncbi:MAG: hypothetical protein KKG06_02310 [Bacteroidetes bacterium]|nr:hypothetical protein [Bacteroidota bacterium]MBU1422013.1 hypothetical protein [Bacteroidota bacterium]